MRARNKKWALPFINAHKDIVINSIDDPSFFHSPLYLEIGTGKGGFILNMPLLVKGHYLGIEKDSSILAIAARKAFESNNKEVKFLWGDFDKLFPLIEKLRFDGIYLNFSDPWPKLKHHKRRLTYGPRLSNIASLLNKGGLIYIKTDNADLFSFTIEEAKKIDLEIVSKDDNYQLNELDVETEYEKSFREMGVSIHRLILRKKENN